MNCPRLRQIATVLAVLMAAWPSLGCGDATPAEDGSSQLSSSESAVRELEGLSFVPNGRTFIGSPLDVGSSVDLLVDRYEVRQSLWRRWIGPEDPIPGAFHPDSAWRETRPKPLAWTLEVPAVGMSLEEARRVSKLRGMRLPTFDEWLWCAVGPTCRRVPAGRLQQGFANTMDMDLQRPTPVGAFESGKTPETGIYDMLGNVWEWIEPPPERRRTRDVWNETAWPEHSAKKAPAWVLGGSFTTQDGLIYSRDNRLLALAVTEGRRSSEIGFRCCVDADVYFAGLPTGVNPSKEQTQRLEAVGARWGPRANSALEEALELAPRHSWLIALQRGAEGEDAQ